MQKTCSEPIIRCLLLVLIGVSIIGCGVPTGISTASAAAAENTEMEGGGIAGDMQLGAQQGPGIGMQRREYFYYDSPSLNGPNLVDVIMMEVKNDGTVQGYSAWGAKSLKIESIRDVLMIEYPYGKLLPDGNFEFFDDAQMTKLFGTYTKSPEGKLIFIMPNGKPAMDYALLFFPEAN
ncbi:MAG: hypothetical protein ACRCVN_04820 [Spirochaetia bacterium]